MPHHKSLLELNPFSIIKEKIKGDLITFVCTYARTEIWSLGVFQFRQYIKRIQRKTPKLCKPRWQIRHFRVHRHNNIAGSLQNVQGSLARSVMASTVIWTAQVSLASIPSALPPQPLTCSPEQEPPRSPSPLQAVRLHLSKKGQPQSLPPSPEMCFPLLFMHRQENSDPAEM